jgi:hypothetical protein
MRYVWIGRAVAVSISLALGPFNFPNERQV